MAVQQLDRGIWRTEPDTQGHMTGGATAGATRMAYRLLVIRGLDPQQAANLTAYASGLPVHDAHWSIDEVNRLVFLRELARSGHFGPNEGAARRT